MKRQNEIYRSWSDWRVGDFIIGRILRFRLDPYYKQNAIMKIEDLKWKFKKNQRSLIGKNILIATVAGTTGLKYVKRGPKNGDLVKISYLGVRDITNGYFKGKQYHHIQIDLVEEI